MKASIYLSMFLFLFANLSKADVANCLIKTDNEHEIATMSVEISEEGHGPMEYFETDSFRVLLTSSKEFLVIGIVLKRTNQSVSFHGKTNSSGIGGQLIDGDEWIQVSCQ